MTIVRIPGNQGFACVEEPLRTGLDNYAISLDGELLKGCVGASTDEGWADLMVLLDEKPQEPQVIEWPDGARSFLWLDATGDRFMRIIDGSPQTERKFGIVTIEVTPRVLAAAG